MRSPVSVALTDGAGAGLWYGGAKLARDLTLPRRRDESPTGSEQQRAAVAAWSGTTLAPAIVGPPNDAELSSRYTDEVTALRQQLRSVPIDDHQAWARVAHDTAGAFAAWSRAVEQTPGALADTAEVLARAAQLRARQVGPRPAGRPSTRGAAMLLASAAVDGRGRIAQTMLLRQLANTVRALHDARRAAGDAQLADEIRRVMLEQLQRVLANAAVRARVDAARAVRRGAP